MWWNGKEGERGEEDGELLLVQDPPLNKFGDRVDYRHLHARKALDLPLSHIGPF